MTLTQCQFDQVSGLSGCQNILLGNERYLCSTYLRDFITGDETLAYDGYSPVLKFASLFRFDRQMFADFFQEQGNLEFFQPLIHSFFFWFTVAFFFLSVIGSLILFKLLRSKSHKTKSAPRSQTPHSATATCLHCLWAIILLTAAILSLIRVHTYFASFRDDVQSLPCRITHFTNNALFHTQVVPTRPPTIYKGYLSQYRMLQTLRTQSSALAGHFQKVSGPVSLIGRPMIESVLAPIVWTGANFNETATTYRGWMSRNGTIDREFGINMTFPAYEEAETWMKDNANPFGKTLGLLQQSAATFDGSGIAYILKNVGESLEYVRSRMDEFAGRMSKGIFNLNEVITSFIEGSWSKVKWLQFSAALSIKLSIALLVASVLIWVQIIFADNRRKKIPSGVKLFLLFTLIGMALYQALGWIGMIVSGWGGSLCDFVKTDLITAGRWGEFKRTEGIPAEVVRSCLNSSATRRGFLEEYGVNFEELWKRENFLPELRESVESAERNGVLDMSTVMAYLELNGAVLSNVTSDNLLALTSSIGDYFGSKRVDICVDGGGRCGNLSIVLNHLIIFNENVSQSAVAAPLDVAALTTSSDVLLRVFPIDSRAYHFAELLQQAAKRSMILTDFQLEYGQSPHLFSHCPTFRCPLFWSLYSSGADQVTFSQWLKNGQVDVITLLNKIKTVENLLQTANSISQSRNPITTFRQQVSVHDSEYDCSLLLYNIKQSHYYTCERAVGNLGLLSLSWLQLSLVHYATFIVLAIYWRHRPEAASPPPPTPLPKPTLKDSELKGNFLAAAMQGDLNALVALRPYVDISNCKDEMYGNTPLHIASFHGHTHCVEWLLIAGVNPNQKNNMGHTPLSAVNNTTDMPTELKQQIVTLLTNHGAKIDP